MLVLSNFRYLGIVSQQNSGIRYNFCFLPISNPSLPIFSETVVVKLSVLEIEIATNIVALVHSGDIADPRIRRSGVRIVSTLFSWEINVKLANLDQASQNPEICSF